MRILLNTLGDNNCRPKYKEALVDYFGNNLNLFAAIAGNDSRNILSGYWIAKWNLQKPW